MRINFILLLFSLFFFFPKESSGQVFNTISKDDIVKELEKRNIALEDLEAALAEKGIILDELSPETLSYDDRQTIQQVILDLTNQKSNESSLIKKQKDTLPSIEVPNIEIDSIPIDTTINKKVKPEISIWGQDLFTSQSLLIKSNNNILKAPETYILGPGDELILSIWGRSQVDNNHVIDEKGFIKILDNRVRVFLKGLSLSAARSKVKNILLQEYNFKEGEFDLTVNYSRTLRVSIFGEINGNPGAYALAGFNSAFNALAAVDGPSDFGSLRNILLQKTGGQKLVMDIYEFMINPTIQSDFYLDEGDIIIVPVQENIVTIEGAVKRPLKYEMLESEGLFDLIKFSGGFKENAYLKKIQIKRFANDQRNIIDLNWQDLKANNNNFKLKDGDVVVIEDIEKEARNYVTAKGEVDKPADYERLDNMRLLDLVNKVGINSNTSRDIIYITRTNDDGTKSMLKINLAEVLNDSNSSQNIALKDLDLIDFWSKTRFADDAIVTISGAVREEGDYPYDQSGQLTVVDAIRLAGGLRRDASNYATIHKNDPLNQNRKYYKTIDNLLELVDNPTEQRNFILNPFDSLVIESSNEFDEELFVRIEGAVNNPGKFQYGEGMSIKDLMILAKGFKIAASTNNIEVSRVIRKDNQPTSIVVAILEVDKDYNVLTAGTSNGEYLLEPFDNIAVRYIKDFELQKRVFLSGEVLVPGPYAIYKDNLKISTIIKKAGGITEEAYLGGATLFREEEGIGKIVIKLDEILRDESSEFNFSVKNGDRINIPTINEFVAIRGATRVEEVIGEGAINENNEIKVPFQKGKDAMYYINEHAGGLSENADKSKIFVEYANGEIKKPKPGFLKRKYPEVLEGSVITVGYKSIELEEKESKENVDWTKVLGDSVGQAMSILTLILLIQRLE